MKEKKDYPEVINDTNMLFEKFPKIPRLNRDCVITEKIDGTNAQIYIDPYGNIFAGSRNRWITPGKKTDNHGFAQWVEENTYELLEKLGPGRHFGEWWGQGIQRGYGMDKKVFSLFNVHKWSDDSVRPKCCSVVPVLYEGPFSTDTVRKFLGFLQLNGSYASPGFMRPEGVVVFHKAAGKLFKATIENDESPKGASNG